MSFNSKGSSDATEIFQARIDASKGGPLRDRDEDPLRDGGFGPTITDLAKYFPEAVLPKVNHEPDPASPPLDFELKEPVVEPEEPVGYHYADDKIVEHAEAQLQEAVVVAMREPEVRHQRRQGRPRCDRRHGGSRGRRRRLHQVAVRQLDSIEGIEDMADLTGRAFYESWARRVNRGLAPNYEALDADERRLWAELSEKVAARRYTDGSKKAAKGIKLEETRRVGEYDQNQTLTEADLIHDGNDDKSSVLGDFFDQARFEKSGSVFDQLLTRIATERDGKRDLTDNAATGLQKALASMVDDSNLRAALAEAFAAVGTDRAVQKAFLSAFFDRVVDDSAIFVR